MATFRTRGDKWQVQIRVKNRTPVSKSFRLKADADLWALQTEAALMRQPVAQAFTNVTLGQALIRYENTVSQAKRGHAAEVYMLRTLKAHPLAGKPIDQVTPAGVAALRDDRLKLVSPSSVRRELALLQHCVHVAIAEWGCGLKANPVAAVRKPKQANPRQRRI